MDLDIGAKMTRKRVSEAEERDSARILAERKSARERLLEEARNNPKPRCSFIASWFHGLQRMGVL